MNSRIDACVIPFVGLAICLAGSINAAAQENYTVIDLSVSLRNGYYFSEVRGINERGQIVGQVSQPYCGGCWRAALWHMGAVTVLPELYTAYAINNKGQIVGQGVGTVSYDFPALWDKGVVTNLGSFSVSFAGGVAYGISDLGQIVGSTWTDKAPHFDEPVLLHAFFWKDGVITDITPFSDRSTAAVGINNSGQVVINSFFGLIWENKKMTFRFALDRANAINNKGQIVGLGLDLNEILQCDFTLTGCPSEQAVLLQRGSYTGLGRLGIAPSEALAINDKGQVVGEAYLVYDIENNTFLKHAFLWEKGVFRDLNTLIPPNSGWELQSAHAIKSPLRGWKGPGV